MWISARTQYGLRALVQLVARGRTTPLKTLVLTQNISENFLEQIFADLKRHGFVISTRGANGGYRLNARLEVLTAWDIVEALEGGVAPVTA